MVLVRPITAGLMSRSTKSSISRGHEIASEMKFVYGKKLYHIEDRMEKYFIVMDSENLLTAGSNERKIIP
jgi:hypothetical protein